MRSHATRARNRESIRSYARLDPLVTAGFPTPHTPTICGVGLRRTRRFWQRKVIEDTNHPPDRRRIQAQCKAGRAVRDRGARGFDVGSWAGIGLEDFF
jgi:hypothetical protein